MYFSIFKLLWCFGWCFVHFHTIDIYRHKSLSISWNIHKILVKGKGVAANLALSHSIVPYRTLWKLRAVWFWAEYSVLSFVLVWWRRTNANKLSRWSAGQGCDNIKRGKDGIEVSLLFRDCIDGWADRTLLYQTQQRALVHQTRPNKDRMDRRCLLWGGSNPLLHIYTLHCSQFYCLGKHTEIWSAEQTERTLSMDQTVCWSIFIFYTDDKAGGEKGLMLDCTKLLKLLCIHILYRLRGLWTDDRKDCSIALYTKQFAAPYSNCVTSEGGSNVALFYCTLYSLREFKHQLVAICIQP